MNYKLMKNFLDTILVLMVSFFMLTQVFTITGFALEDEVIEITTIEDLANISKNLEANYVLLNDLDLSFDTSDPDGNYYNEGKGWKPIGTIGNPFKGSLDGNGFTIKGVTINRTNESYLGLFGFTRASTLTNIVLEDVDILGKQYIGALVGQADSTQVYSISVSGIVSGRTYVGGIVGYANRTHINQVFSKVSVTGSIAGVGGVVGRLGRNATLEDAHSMAHVTTTHCGDSNSSICAVGGVVGQMDDLAPSVRSVFFNGILTNKSDERINERDSKFYAKPVIGRKRGGITSDLYYYLEYNSELAERVNDSELELETSYGLFDFDRTWVINQTARLQGLYYFEEPTTLVSISVSQLPIQLIFDADEPIDLEGLQVTANYNDEMTEIIDENEYIIEISKEEQKVTITYQEQSTSFSIVINEVSYYKLSVVNHGYGGRIVVYQDDQVVEDLSRIREGSVTSVKTVLEPMGRVEHVLLNDLPFDNETFVMERDLSLKGSFYLLGDINNDGILNKDDLEQYVSLIHSQNNNKITDTNEDGNLDVADFVTLRNHVREHDSQNNDLNPYDLQGIPTINIVSTQKDENEVTIKLQVNSVNQAALYLRLNPSFEYQDVLIECGEDCSIDLEEHNRTMIVYPTNSETLLRSIELTITYQTIQHEENRSLTLSEIHFSNSIGTLVYYLDNQIISIADQEKENPLPRLDKVIINDQTVFINHSTNEMLYSTSKKSTTVNAIANDENHIIFGIGKYMLIVGLNIFELTVSNEQQVVTYYLHITHSIPFIEEENDIADKLVDKENPIQNEISDDGDNMPEKNESNSVRQENYLPRTEDQKFDLYSLFMFILGFFLVLIGKIDNKITTKSKE